MAPSIENIRFVYFDLDDTLLDHKKAQIQALTDVIHHFQDEFDGIDLHHVQRIYHERNVLLWRRYSAGSITKETLREERFTHLLESFSITTLTHDQVSAVYMDRYAHHWEYTEDARSTFLAIAERFPVGILTNGFAETQKAKLARFPDIRNQLAVTVISEEIGYLKPHPELFRQAAERAQTHPAHILYVGDSYTSDVEGARNAGWQVIWYAPDADHIPEGIHALQRLQDLPERIA